MGRQARADTQEQPTTPPGDISREEIARLAYELYEQRGGQDGQDVADWLKAEAVLKARRQANPQPRENGKRQNRPQLVGVLLNRGR